MKEILKEWEEFAKLQQEARKKVADRMLLWDKENPPQFGGLYDYGMTYRCYEITRKSEEFSLQQKFGVVDITLENLLNSLLTKHN